MIEIRVVGEPAPQGSKRHVGHGVMIESSRKVKPWREAVKFAALDVLRQAGIQGVWARGPVVAEMTFYFRKPKRPKFSKYPATYPDLSKIIRSTEDALTDAGVWADDALVVEMHVYKRWAKLLEADPKELANRSDRWAQGQLPGAWIVVYEAKEAEE